MSEVTPGLGVAQPSGDAAAAVASIDSMVCGGLSGLFDVRAAAFPGLGSEGLEADTRAPEGTKAHKT